MHLRTLRVRRATARVPLRRPGCIPNVAAHAMFASSAGARAGSSPFTSVSTTCCLRRGRSPRARPGARHSPQFPANAALCLSIPSSSDTSERRSAILMRCKPHWAESLHMCPEQNGQTKHPRLQQRVESLNPKPQQCSSVPELVRFGVEFFGIWVWALDLGSQLPGMK